MFKILVDSLTLNSIGLFVLGLVFLVTYFWNRRKSSKDSNVVVIDGISESLLSRLFRIKSLLIGIGFIGGAIIWGIQDYERSVMDRNIQILEETLSIVRSSEPLDAKRRAVRDMESLIALSILEKQNKKSMEEWYGSSDDLRILKKTIKSPECIILYYLYEEILEFKNLDKLDRVYSEFYKDYWGESTYIEKDKKSKDYKVALEMLVEEFGYTKEQAREELLGYNPILNFGKYND